MGTQDPRWRRPHDDSDVQWATATFNATLPNTTTTTGWTTFLSTVNNPVGFTMAGQYRWVLV